MHKGYEEIEEYIAEMKEAVSADRYRIERNKKRQANSDLYREYVIDEAKSKDILMNLTVHDFAKPCGMNIWVMNMNCYMCSGKMSGCCRGSGRKKKWFPYISNAISWKTGLLS